ncbi:MAG: prolipoprotein diacylglyceryl transferase, partial [Acidimicrobiia bacterium]|nr:prolipoprotein diacylglyceryl transferase [Acidimicrobiia bacterium]
IERRFTLMKGQVLALYLILYTAGRFVLENMRTDSANMIGPLRLNAWVSLIVCIGGILWFLWLRGHGTPSVPHVDRLPASVDQLPES